jgi:hypothetical protein
MGEQSARNERFNKMSDPRIAAIRQNYAHRVESIGALRSAILCDPILGNLDQFALLGRSDMLFRICSISTKRLHLDEDQRALMESNKVELAQRTTEIAGEDTMAGLLQKICSRLLPPFSDFVARL